MPETPEIEEMSGAWDYIPTQDPGVCEWFLLCDRPADTTRSHPILGNVPICRRCDTNLEGMK